MQLFKNLQQFLREKPKQTDKTNLFQTHECEFMENTYSWVEKKSLHMQIWPRNGNHTKLSKKHLEKAKNSPFSLQLFVMIWYIYFSMSIFFKKIQ